MTNKATIGIDLWHAVEFSRYGCALLHRISPTFQGRPPNLVHPRRRGQTGLNEVLDLAEAQLLGLLRLLSGLNPPLSARDQSIQRGLGPVKSVLSKSKNLNSITLSQYYLRPLVFMAAKDRPRLVQPLLDLAFLFAKPHIYRIKSQISRV